MPKAAGMQFVIRIRNSPGALALGARGLSTTARRGEPALPIKELGDLSNDQRNKVNPGELNSCRRAKRISHHRNNRIGTRRQAQLDSPKRRRRCAILSTKQQERNKSESLAR
ncbi:MAG: hypothetical protein DME87_00450 [Verrucomicrobia bacterium]|nr:MAG: hypothetical protein DME87_00450 [Verrucomicrobiota bacterium]